MPDRLGLITLLFALLCALPALAQDETAVEAPDEVAIWTTENLPEGVDREAAANSLRDAGENWTQLAASLEACAGNEADLADMLWLLANAPHLDRLELQSAMLDDNLELARQWCGESGYQQGSEFFRRYILNYRIDDEPVTDWRRELMTRYQPEVVIDRATETIGKDLASELVSRVADGFTIVDFVPNHDDKGPALQVRALTNGETQEFWVYRAPILSYLNQNGNYHYEFAGLEDVYATGLQVSLDPGVKITLTGCAIAIPSLLWALFGYHHRVWVRLEPQKLHIAWSAHKKLPELEARLDQVLANLSGTPREDSHG